VSPDLSANNAPGHGTGTGAPAPGSTSEAAARGYDPASGARPPASGTAPRGTGRPTARPGRRGPAAGPGSTGLPSAAPGALPEPARAPATGEAERRARTGGPATPPAAPRARATGAGATGAAASAAAGPGTAAAPPLGAEDRGRLLSGFHHDPHSLLGAHPLPDGSGVLIRALRPHAVSVEVLTGSLPGSPTGGTGTEGGPGEGLRLALRDEGDGLFAGVLPLDTVPEGYRLLIRYPDGATHETRDPYSFLPTLGELDLHLIGEGRHEELWRVLGAEPMTHAGVAGTRFAVWAPGAQGVRVAGDFTVWDGTSAPMRSLGSSGVWELFLPGVGEGAAYKFEVAGRDGVLRMKADPMARRAEVPPATASIVTAAHHEWRDADWMAARGSVPAHEAPMSVYEVHLPSWRPGLGYRELADQLTAYVTELGFTHVELMPVAEHPFGGSWGYQVTSYYAPTSRLGSPDDFRHLVDSLHRAGIGVIMDWVPAHFPKDDWALASFDGGPMYEHPWRGEHPDWGTLEFDLGRREVRNFLVANAVYWCEEFHIDGLRVDAVASMLYLDYSRSEGEWAPNVHGGREDLDAVAFLQEMNATVYRRCPGVVTIAEESTAWDGVTRPTHVTGPGGFGGLGFGLKWNMGWMHDSLQYMAHEPVHRRYHHNELTFSMVYAYSENYVLPISHDEVVHGKGSLVAKMPGDWWQQRANLRAYLAYMWAHPGKQLLFMGQEFAQGAEWSHDHGPEWWLTDPAYGAAGDHVGVRDLVHDLNTLYTATPALWQRDIDPAGFSWIDGAAAEDNVLSFLRYDTTGEPLISVSNFAPVVRHGYRVGVPDGPGAWHEVLNSDATHYGGSGILNPEPLKSEPVEWNSRPHSVALTLPPLATLWLRPAST
jgi:1,4-alpha-glucan branching enzyme